MNAMHIIGANPEESRMPTDLYPTPPEVTIALIDFLRLPKSTSIWEPAAGTGAMAKVFRDNGYSVLETDISTGDDFLKNIHAPSSCDWIITNPPFSKADEFIDKCLQHQLPFALLLKSQFWHAKKRAGKMLIAPPSFICPLMWRPDFNGKGASMMDVCWNIWMYPKTYDTIYKPLERPEV